MRLPVSARLIATIIMAAFACTLYIANVGPNLSLASEGDDAGREDETPTLESLTERIIDLEARVVELEINQDQIAAQGLAFPVFDTVSAVYLLDQVDIHALYERLHEGDGIMPGDAGQIRRLVPLLSAVDWPPELAEEGDALVETLTQLSAPLADDDLESAVALASAAHEAQHHFSCSVADWFDSLHAPEEEQEQEEYSESADDGDGHGDDNGDDDDSQDMHDDGNGDDNGEDDDSQDTHDDGHDPCHGG